MNELIRMGFQITVRPYELDESLVELVVEWRTTQGWAPVVKLVCETADKCIENALRYVNGEG